MTADNSIADLVVRAHHTAFSCNDYAAARIFFVDILGFKVVGEMESRSGDGLDVVVGMPGASCHWAMLELGRWSKWRWSRWAVLRVERADEGGVLRHTLGLWLI